MYAIIFSSPKCYLQPPIGIIWLGLPCFTHCPLLQIQVSSLPLKNRMENHKTKIAAIKIATLKIVFIYTILSFPLFNERREVKLVFGYAKRKPVAFCLLVLLFAFSVYVKNFITKNNVVVSVIFEIRIP